MKKTLTLRQIVIKGQPFESASRLMSALYAHGRESRYLEFKELLPFGCKVLKLTKYRFIKAVISFANTFGGFVVIGVTRDGKWQGLPRGEVESVDPATLTELINDCIGTELPEISYKPLSFQKKWFGVVWIPKSNIAPHITTKDLTLPKDEAGSEDRFIIRKNSIYCRYDGKSDLATYTQLERIIKERVLAERNELIQKVKESPLLTFTRKDLKRSKAKQTVKIIRPGEGPADTIIGLTKDPQKAVDKYLLEEVDREMFEDINNLVETAEILAKESRDFPLSEDLYYKIYYKRAQVQAKKKYAKLLTLAGLGMYAPFLYWMEEVDVAELSAHFKKMLEEPKSPSIRSLLNLAILDGNRLFQYVTKNLYEKYKDDPQPPDWYWAFQEMSKRLRQAPPLLAALRMSEKTVLIPAGIENIPERTVKELLENPIEAENYLTLLCKYYIEKKLIRRTLIRQLDLIVYGNYFKTKSDRINLSHTGTINTPIQEVSETTIIPQK